MRAVGMYVLSLPPSCAWRSALRWPKRLRTASVRSMSSTRGPLRDFYPFGVYGGEPGDWAPFGMERGGMPGC